MADNNTVPSGQVEKEDFKSLAYSINTAILSSHTKINRLILDRMPRAVPPQTDNPSTYITGLLHFGAVYVAFESLWQSILGIHTEIAPIPYTYPFSNDPTHRDETPQITERTRHILEVMYWPNMLRYGRINADIRTMTGWPKRMVDEQIRSVGTTGRLARFLAHVQESITAKPHLLLAYAYGLYLALLSGGSYIRTELMYLKADFWQAAPMPIKPNMIPCNTAPGSSQMFKRHETFEYDSAQHGLAESDSVSKMPLEFLDFTPPLGENPRQQTKDLKAGFKRRFTDAEQALTEPERKDIIRESVEIFQHLEEVVGQLDKICDTPQVKGHIARVLNPPPQSHPRTANLGYRLRDSIAIAKGRLLRTRWTSSGGTSVTATAPTCTSATESATPSADFSSFKPSPKQTLLSSSSDFQDAQSKHQPSPGSELALDAVVPGEGLRTIHYDSGLPASDTSSLKNKDLEMLHGGLDGTDDLVRRYDGYCPIARVSSADAATTSVGRDDPYYPPNATISNLIVLVGLALLYTAYLYARHRDFEEKPLDLRMGKDW